MPEPFTEFLQRAASGCTMAEFTQAYNALGYGQEILDAAVVGSSSPQRIDELREALVERGTWADRRPAFEKV